MAFYLRLCLSVAALLTPPQIPTFACWEATHHYIADEVDYCAAAHGCLTPAALRARYRMSPHPAWVSFINCRNAFRYRGGFDGLVADDYPFYRGIGDAAALAEWAQTVMLCRQVARRLRVPLVLIMQGFGSLRDGSMIWRCPTAADVRRMLLLAGAIPVARYTDPRAPC
jgi:hypothetical protein